MPGEVTNREYKNSDGTVTVQSDYILVPSRETHKETLTCVTTYNEEVFTDSVTLDIQCKSFSHMAKKKAHNKPGEIIQTRLIFSFVYQMSQMFLWTGLMETGTITERTSS